MVANDDMFPRNRVEFMNLVKLVAKKDVEMCMAGIHATHPHLIEQIKHHNYTTLNSVNTVTTSMTTQKQQLVNQKQTFDQTSQNTEGTITSPKTTERARKGLNDSTVKPSVRKTMMHLASIKHNQSTPKPNQKITAVRDIFDISKDSPIVKVEKVDRVEAKRKAKERALKAENKHIQRRAKQEQILKEKLELEEQSEKKPKIEKPLSSRLLKPTVAVAQKYKKTETSKEKKSDENFKDKRRKQNKVTSLLLDRPEKGPQSLKTRVEEKMHRKRFTDQEYEQTHVNTSIQSEDDFHDENTSHEIRTETREATISANEVHEVQNTEQPLSRRLLKPAWISQQNTETNSPQPEERVIEPRQKFSPEVKSKITIAQQTQTESNRVSYDHIDHSQDQTQYSSEDISVSSDSLENDSKDPDLERLALKSLLEEKVVLSTKIYDNNSKMDELLGILDKFEKQEEEIRSRYNESKMHGYCINESEIMDLEFDVLKHGTDFEMVRPMSVFAERAKRGKEQDQSHMIEIKKEDRILEDSTVTKIRQYKERYVKYKNLVRSGADVAPDQLADLLTEFLLEEILTDVMTADVLPTLDALPEHIAQAEFVLRNGFMDSTSSSDR